MKAFRGSLFLLMILLTWNSQAQVQSKFMLSIDLNQELPLIDNSNGSSQEKEEIPNFIIAEPYSTQIEGVRAEWKQSWNLHRTGMRQWHFEFQGSNLEIQIDKIKTDHLIKVHQGGVDLNIRILGECQNIHLTLEQGGLRALGLAEIPQLQTQPSFQMKELHVEGWESLKWQIRAESCQGMKGYEGLVLQKIQEFINPSQKIQDLLQSQIQQKWDKWNQGWQTKLYSPIEIFNESGLRVLAHPKSSFINSKEKIELFGDLEFHTAQNPLIQNVEFTDFTFKEVCQDLQAQESVTLKVPKNLLPSIVALTHQSQLINPYVLTTDIPQLSSLMSSRFVQFFVWPDLMKFPKNSPFLLKGEVTQLEVSASTSDKTLRPQFSIKADGNIAMFYSNDQQWWPYINFPSHMDSLWSLQIRGPDLVMQNEKVQLDMSTQWDLQYVEKRSPNKRIQLNTLVKALKESIEENALHIPLKPISVLQKAPLYFHRINFEEDVACLYLGIQPPPDTKPITPPQSQKKSPAYENYQKLMDY